MQQGSSPTQDAPAFIIKAGINLPSASGAWAFGAVVGYGDFGGSIQANQTRAYSSICRSVLEWGRTQQLRKQN